VSAPLVVNTTDGTVWTRREGTRGGEALYAPEKCGTCPQFVMVTMTELAELGIAGSADVLPMPVGTEPQANEPFVPQTERSHWAAIADALNAAEAAGMSVGIDLDGTLTDHNAWSVVWDRDATRWEVAEYEDETATEQPPLTVFRASHDSIVMGLYRTAAEARKHCETQQRREYEGTDTTATAWWVEDEDTVDQPELTEAELYEHTQSKVVPGPGLTRPTGYVVTALEIAAKYDEGADE
jgi:hypothetical protein